MDPIQVEYGVLLAIFAAFAILPAWPWATIMRKSGNDQWNALWMIIPGINILAFMIFAFGEWPALKTQEHTLVCDDCENPVAEPNT